MGEGGEAIRRPTRRDVPDRISFSGVSFRNFTTKPLPRFPRTPHVKPLPFRSRLFAILLLFAAVPAVVITLAWAGSVSTALPLVSGSAAWDNVAVSGERTIAALRKAPLTAEQRGLLAAHEQELRSSLEQARRLQFLASRSARVIATLAVVGLVVLGALASRVAGHLSRQLSRPLDELVRWTELIGRGDPLPQGPPRRGAPEFAVLRERMRLAAAALGEGRARAIEAERLRAFRESARQVAHELKNPLTPIRFAVARLRREAPPQLAETIDVLATETERMEAMARSFAQFGRLPEGPAAAVDMGELVGYVAKAAVPPEVALAVRVEEALPMVHGHHDALARALSNVLLNAVDACRPTGEISVAVRRHELAGAAGVEVVVRDTGCGMSSEQLERMWEPYVTHKPGGTGLGLAIARQTVAAHNGTVSAASAPGEGTEVRLVLPAGAPVNN
jgi:signal transduction histidine kinase